MNTFLRIWLAPIIIGSISAAGLVSALAGDGMWDVLSWICLGVPLMIITYFFNKNLGLKTPNKFKH